MNFAVIFALASLLFVSFVSVQKRIHPYEHVFVWLAFVFVFANTTDLAVPRNGENLKLASSTLLYASQRIWEIIIIPLVILLYLEASERFKNRPAKVLAFFICSAVLYGLEVLAVHLHLFSYLHWKMGWSLLTWLVALGFAWLMRIGMRKLLRREGVLP